MSEATPPPAEPTGQSRQPGPRYSGGGTNPVAGMNVYDLAIIACGVLAFIFSLFSYYTASYAGVSGSESAWHGFFGWFAALCALAGSALLAAALFGTRLPLPTRLAVFGLYVVATICVILALLVIPGKVSGAGVDFGHGIGYWLSLIVILVGVVLSFLRKDATD